MRQHKEQFNLYKSSLDYIVFTDYLHFHVYEHGEWVKNIRIGEQQGNHIRMIKGRKDTNSNPFHRKSAHKRLLFNNFKECFENFNGTLVICVI